MNNFLQVSLTWKWLLRPLLTMSRTPSICRGNTSKQTTPTGQLPAMQNTNRSFLINTLTLEKTGLLTSFTTVLFTFTLAMTLIKSTRIRERVFCLLLSRGSVWRGDGRGNCRHPEARRHRQPRDGNTTGGRRWRRAGSQNTAHSGTGGTQRHGQTVRPFNLSHSSWSFLRNRG